MWETVLNGIKTRENIERKKTAEERFSLLSWSYVENLHLVPFSGMILGS
ncbi:conserved hypothetical protein [delta proteobacterium NaphS2]|nr:conserved hypothetical protein [delta proteobacterium NaphS2]